MRQCSMCGAGGNKRRLNGRDDIALPDGSGYDLVAEAKRKLSVKAVALTGFGTPDDIERGKEAGFDFHLTKPVDFHELRAVLGQIAA